MKKLLSLVAIGLLILGCKNNEKPPEVRPVGLVIENMDTTVKPGDNFFEYANGEWLKTAEMYPGTPFNGNMIEITFRTEDQIGDILQEVLKEEAHPKNSSKGQIQAFYKSYVDTLTRNQLGVKPIQPEIDKILSATTFSELYGFMGLPLIPKLWDEYIFLDAKNTKRYLPTIGQRDLGMGGIEYYLDDTPRNKTIREKYLKLIETYFTLSGIDKPTQRAQSILDLETNLAKVYWTATQKRNPNKMYHLMTADELKNYAPGIDWQAYWDTKGKDGYKEIIVHTDTAIQGVSEILGQTKLEDVKSLITFYFIKSAASALSDEFDHADFEFYKKTLVGIANQRPLETRAKGISNEVLKWQLGELYADKYYTPEIEKQAKLYISYMHKAILKSLTENPWMDEETKKEAINKFNNINWKIGRPEKTGDLSVLEFDAKDYVGNLRKITA
ncbi:M13 family metallopeptidase [Tamlana agarivorans]|uniref:M13 family metallopeptidase n=1 Tax=Pseudotamlana agarivorans TaxID=481183 RepID=A0ACC5U831_9FLAO|nr:M13 family metallopeptidase [Tamlana agarivorans]MBU2950445.1 M13 family metallopeptidase [Tamlana agarivorans]